MVIIYKEHICIICYCSRRINKKNTLINNKV